jgi:YgiT-type zinc finger domain-containing protein
MDEGSYRLMSTTQCNFCGGEQFEERRIDYLYSHRGKYLLVPNTPVEVCSSCGMVYYDAKVLKEIERRFFAIQNHKEEPDRYLQIPSVVYS